MGHAARSGILSLATTLLLAACGGGGGGGSANVSFGFQAAGLTLAESDGAVSVTVELNLLLPELPADVSVEVYDLGTGSATSGSDYAAFAPIVVTFAAGEVDGATQVVTLDPLDDDLVEEPGQTVRLGLRAAVGGVPAGKTTLLVTLQDEDTAHVEFATDSNAAPEASSSQAVALALGCAAGVTLEVPVSVRVSDLRTGTAVPPGDYAAFAAQTVTFPAGAGNGALQTVNLNVNMDAVPEGDETIELGLSQPSAACTLGATLTHVFTIQSNDPAEFVASQGATGTENALTYDELVHLGTDAVGGAASAGTLVRVANLGGQPMDLGTPSLAGNHPNDFAVEVESSSLAPLADGAGAGFPAADAGVAPLALLADDAGPGVVMGLEPTELARMGERSAVALHGLVLPELGAVTLELARRPLPIAPDARLVVDGAEIAGGPRTLLGELELWSGVVAGLPGSRAFLALDGAGLQGYVQLPAPAQGLVHVFPEGDGRVRLVSEPELLALGASLPEGFCAGARLVPGAVEPLGFLQDDPDAPTSSALTMANCRLALETDYQLYDKFDSTVLLTNYVTSLIGAVSDQYATDVQATLSIAYLGIHTTADDGWDTQEAPGGDAGDLLSEFRTAWTTPGSWPVAADLAHFLSGDSLGGGVAYVNVLCNQSFGFGVSGSLTGTINWLTWTGQAAAFTWDFVVVAHELGHNFGSSHTHDYCPPLDQCYSNCNGSTVCTRGTLMSYCHVGCGGMSNIDLWFHPVTANIMRQRVNSSCLGQAALMPGDHVRYRVRFNPLTTTGARSATLSFSHDAPNATQPFRIQLGGNAN
ncbi:MAG TPA: M12 family metallo-peptidase [Planctomycetota bacterium]